MKKVVVVGGSAGGIQALCRMLQGIPPDFSAPVLAVIHLGDTTSLLPQVLQRSSRLPVKSPTDAEPLRAGHVYVASPNRHLVVRAGCAASIMGPRENRHRPSVDALFRSAARAYRRSVIAVVLSGALDDGSAGALAIKARGGTVIVQDPDEAEVPDMPLNVVRQVGGNECLSIHAISERLVRLVRSRNARDIPEVAEGECDGADNTHPMEPIAYTCPECGGALMEVKQGKGFQLRCHVGHRFSLESFSEGHADAVERAVWVAMRKLRERQSIYEQLAKDRNGPYDAGMRKRFKENAAAAMHDIGMLEEVLARL